MVLGHLVQALKPSGGTPAWSTREATQRLEPRFRLLDSAGFSLRIEISRFARIAERPGGSPFAKDQRIISFGEREACLNTAHVGGALQHESRRPISPCPTSALPRATNLAAIGFASTGLSRAI
jgi:hypothetical protein